MKTEFEREEVYMIRIAICDDSIQDLEKMSAMIHQFVLDHSIIAELKTFNHVDVLLDAIGVDHFHIYILDIVMPMVNGIDLGKAIRRTDREAQLIYTTTESQFALQAYVVFPINYLIKPIAQQALFETLNLAISKLKLNEDQTFNIKTSDRLRVVNVSKISYCEYHKHKVIFYMISGEEIVTKTIRESYSEYMSQILGDKHFIQCHASFIVNMRHIEHFTKTSFIMRSGSTIPISSKQYAGVRDKYMDYLMEKRN